MTEATPQMRSICPLHSKYCIWIFKYWTTTAAGAAQYWFCVFDKKDARPKGRPFYRFIDVWDLFPYIVCSMYIVVSQIQSDCVTNSNLTHLGFSSSKMTIFFTFSFSSKTCNNHQYSIIFFHFWTQKTQDFINSWQIP